MAGLPARFARMGFKKGWRAFRSTQSSRTPARQVKPMARRRKSSKRSFARRSHGGGDIQSVLLPAFAYGAVRAQAKTLAQPVTSMLPLGDNADEVAFGLLGYFLAKKGGSPMMRNAGRAILTVEAASLGNNLVAPMIGGLGSTISNAAGNSNLYGV